MLISGLYTIGLIMAFVAYALLCRYETKHQKRVFLARFRAILDAGIVSVATRIERSFRYVARYVIRLSWYYSLHATLMVALRSIAGVYHLIEAVLIKNRERARMLRKEKRKVSHLDHIANHKEESKLSASEIKKRKDKALRGM